MSTRVPQQTLDQLAQGMRTIATTGTNGKTTVTSMVAAIARAAGERVARVTTLGMWVDDEQTAHDGSMHSFVRTLDRARALGARVLALEVTSRALAAGFAGRWPADIAVFTNLSPEHLDRHGTLEGYLAAKAQLFINLAPGATAVLNADDPAAPLLQEVLPPAVTVRRFGRGPAHGDGVDLVAATAEPGVEGTRVILAPGELQRRLGGSLWVGTPGGFNVDNALAAALAADAAGLDAASIKAGLASFPGVEGRFQLLSRNPLCIVDFAHTPDGLRRALQSASALIHEPGGRLGLVFGCGGERDPGKRGPMGEVADRLADHVWLTTDNPRGEDAARIAAAVRAGSRGRAAWLEEPDRGRAIRAAVAWARPADAVVVAGRGHERVQELAAGPVPCSDRELVQSALAARFA